MLLITITSASHYIIYCCRDNGRVWNDNFWDWLTPFPASHDACHRLLCLCQLLILTKIRLTSLSLQLHLTNNFHKYVHIYVCWHWVRGWSLAYAGVYNLYHDQLLELDERAYSFVHLQICVYIYGLSYQTESVSQYYSLVSRPFSFWNFAKIHEGENHYWRQIDSAKWPIYNMMIITLIR